MGKAPVQKERSEKPPVFALDYNSIRLQCADSMQDFRVIQIPNRNLDQEHNSVEHNQHQNRRRASELAMPNTVRDWDGCERNRVVLPRIQTLKSPREREKYDSGPRLKLTGYFVRKDCMDGPNRGFVTR